MTLSGSWFLEPKPGRDNNLVQLIFTWRSPTHQPLKEKKKTQPNPNSATATHLARPRCRRQRRHRDRIASPAGREALTFPSAPKTCGLAVPRRSREFGSWLSSWPPPHPYCSCSRAPPNSPAAGVPARPQPAGIGF